MEPKRVHIDIQTKFIISTILSFVYIMYKYIFVLTVFFTFYMYICLTFDDEIFMMIIQCNSPQTEAYYNLNCWKYRRRVGGCSFVDGFILLSDATGRTVSGMYVWQRDMWPYRVRSSLIIKLVPTVWWHSLWTPIKYSRLATQHLIAEVVSNFLPSPPHRNTQPTVGLNYAPPTNW